MLGTCSSHQYMYNYRHSKFNNKDSSIHDWRGKIPQFLEGERCPPQGNVGFRLAQSVRSRRGGAGTV